MTCRPRLPPGFPGQPTEAPPLLASNDVAEDGAKAVYTDLDLPLTTPVSTAQRLKKIALERNWRRRTLAFQASLSVLWLRPWGRVTVAPERLMAFPAQVTGWALAPDGGVTLQPAEDDAAAWDWNASLA